MSSRSRLRARNKRPRGRRTRLGLPASPTIPRSRCVRQRAKLSLRRLRQQQKHAALTAGPDTEISPPATSAPPASTPAPAPATPVSSPAAELPPQRLSEITGITPQMERKLHQQGHTRFFQLSRWDAKTIDSVAADLEISPEQIHRQRWIAQARRRG